MQAETAAYAVGPYYFLSWQWLGAVHMVYRHRKYRSYRAEDLYPDFIKNILEAWWCIWLDSVQEALEHAVSQALR